MFKCAISRQSSRPGEKPVKLVLETRPKIYYRKDKNGLNVEIGKGFEIVKEVLVRQDALNEVRKNVR